MFRARTVAARSTTEHHRTVIIVIHGSSLRLFDYWIKPLAGRLARSRQNRRFSAVIRLQNWPFPFLDGDKKWFQPEKNPSITDIRIGERN